MKKTHPSKPGEDGVRKRDSIDEAKQAGAGATETAAPAPTAATPPAGEGKSTGADKADPKATDPKPYTGQSVYICETRIRYAAPGKRAKLYRVGARIKLPDDIASTLLLQGRIYDPS